MSSIHCSFGEYAAPVLAVCGYSGSGKTTLLEAAIPRLVQRGLAVAVVKHDAHRFVVDREGKDSDRLFRAGATVSLRGPEEQFERRAEPLSLEATLARLACDHDLVLVEGHKDTALPKFWLAGATQPAPPETVRDIVSVLPWSSNENGGRLAAFLQYVEGWLPEAWRERPLYRGLLLGGKSSRMGRPKQDVQFGDRTLGEIALAALAPAAGAARVAAYPPRSSRQAPAAGAASVAAYPPRSSSPAPAPPRVVLLGSAVPDSGLPAFDQQQGECGPPASGALRLPDAPEFAGPGAAMIAAHRWAPQAAWIISACDHPWISGEHIAWLASQRQPGRWAIVPQQRDGHACPTLALYEPQALQTMERLAMAHPAHNADPSALLANPHTAMVQPPEDLADGWININTPDDLRREQERLATRKNSGDPSNRVQD